MHAWEGYAHDKSLNIIISVFSGKTSAILQHTTSISRDIFVILLE
jgi:hypothetical protein